MKKVEKYLRLRKKGYSYDWIAGKYGVTKQAVHGLIKDKKMRKERKLEEKRKREVMPDLTKAYLLVIARIDEARKYKLNRHYI